MSLRSSFEQLNELGEKRDQVHYDFIKQVLLMSTSLFGILVALHTKPATSDSIRNSFAFSLALLSLGILFLSISLFAQVALHRKLWSLKREDILKQLRDENYKPAMIGAEPSKLYGFFEKFGYLSLLLSVCSLTIYAAQTA